MGKDPRVAIYPGTFDPITNGHIDIIKRAASIFDTIIVAIAKNPSKNVLFTSTERAGMVKVAIAGMPAVEIDSFDGLVVDYAKACGAKVIIRGLRMISDFEYEFQMALTNRNLNSAVETIFLMPHPQYSFVSSRLIKEAAALGADLKSFLPLSVMEKLKAKLAGQSRVRGE